MNHSPKGICALKKQGNREERNGSPPRLKCAKKDLNFGLEKMGNSTDTRYKTIYFLGNPPEGQENYWTQRDRKWEMMNYQTLNFQEM